MSKVLADVTACRQALGRWTLRHWAVAAAAGFFTALVVGVPTGIISTDLYQRMTPVLWWNYPAWALAAVLAGLVAGTYVPAAVAAAAPPSDSVSAPRQTLAGSVLSVFAVGCPVCNKLVVAALGVGGAQSLFAPVQPYLAAGSIVLLGFALRSRLLLVACPVAVRS